MTTNQTIEEINVKLKEAKTKDINIKIESTISTSVHFLDITIKNENGQLRESPPDDHPTLLISRRRKKNFFRYFCLK
jgi:hypothetical protein